MSAYKQDGRVCLVGDGAVVRHHPHDRLVADSPHGWAIYQQPGMTLVGCGHRSMDAAIESLIGPPVVAG